MELLSRELMLISFIITNFSQSNTRGDRDFHFDGSFLFLI